MRKKGPSSKTSAFHKPATHPETGHEKEEPYGVTSDWLRIAEGAANAGFFDWDIRTEHITWSEGIYHLFGLPPDAEPSFATWLAAVHPDDLEPALTRMHESIAKRISLNNEYRIVLPDGHERWINTLGNTFYDEAGKPVRHSGMCIDITVRKEMEEALRESEERFRVLVEASTQAVWETDAAGAVVKDLPSWRAYTGQTLDESLGYGWVDAVHPDDRERVEQLWRQTVAEEKNVNAEFRLKSPGGGYRWTNVVSSPIRNRNGVILKWVGMNIDITERKGIERELRENRAKLEAAINSMTEAVFIADTEGRFVEFNDYCAQYHRFKNRDDFSKSITDCANYIDAYFGDGTPAPLDMWAMSRALRGETASDIEYMLCRKDTGEKWWGSYGFAPIREKDGRIVGAVVAGREITERKRLEEELARGRAELQSLFDSSNVGLVLFEARPPYTVITHNKFYQELFAEPYRTAGMVGKNIYEYAPDIEAQGVVAVLDEVARTGKPVQLFDFPYDSHPPKKSWFNWHLSPIIHEGEVVALASLSIDVTSQHLAEDKLRKVHNDLELRVQARTQDLEKAYQKVLEEMAQKNALADQLRQAHKMEAMGTLAGGIAHDFNNILAAIIGFTEMAIDDVPDRPLVEKNLQKVMTSATRARELVKQILAFSRKTKYERETLALTPVVQETVQLLRASIPATVDVTLSVTATSDTVIAAPVEVQQVVMNLATNALLAMQDRKGSLEIALSDTDFEPDASTLDATSREYLQIMVKDTGVGMSPEVMKRIFDPFFTTREVGTGSGMGLAMVYGIVKDLGGSIAVESEPGQGSTFRIFLPKAKVETREEMKQAVLPRGTERVLFVDDEAMLLEWGGETLQRLGYAVTAVADARQALEIFSADPSLFDLVITDQAMPQMPGSDLCSELLRIRDDIPVILCTGHSETVSPEKAREIGVREFLMKPVKRQELASVIRRVLDRDKG